MNDDNKFPEQQAPEKNTDKAFVQVGKDGEPVMPSENDESSVEKKEEPPTSLDKR